MYDSYKEIMSEGLYTEPGIYRKGHWDQEDNQSTVDIYVSAESLRVYDNPWVEGRSPNAPAPAQRQHAGTDTKHPDQRMQKQGKQI